MARRLLFGAVLLCLLCLAISASAEGTNRVLLVGCDKFVSQPDTTPSSANNVTRMADALSGGMLNPSVLITRRNDLNSTQALLGLIHQAFRDAREEDTSYFYISTHGLWTEGSSAGSMTFLLSDGEWEEGVTADQLRRTFDRIRGKKVLIFDACHSGAVLGKGTAGMFDNVFTGEDYQVICSSGGLEDSWFWRSESGVVSGSGYFSDAVVQGISIMGGYGADANRDGAITMEELQTYLRENHGASTVHVYPEDSGFVLMRYDVATLSALRRRTAITGISFDTGALTGEELSVSFSFTMLRPARVAYQLVHEEGGHWAFDRSELIWDDTERADEEAEQGLLSSGFKERTLTLTRDETEGYGYVLLQLLVVDEETPQIITSRVLCVPPTEGDPGLEVIGNAGFCPEMRQEYTFEVLHSFPCELTLTVEDAEGNLVRRMTVAEASRPEGMDPEASVYTWDGTLTDGSAAPYGSYRIRAAAELGGTVYETLSPAFTLDEPQG